MIILQLILILQNLKKESNDEPMETENDGITMEDPWDSDNIPESVCNSNEEIPDWNLDWPGT